MIKKIIRSLDSDSGGYTLIEVVISLSIFIAIAVPMLCAVISNTGALRSQEALEAVWMLEQEAESIRFSPDEVMPVKHQIIEGRDWTVRIESEGKPLVKYSLTALRKDKVRGSVVMYVYRPQ
ncbi:MAG: hypothetical protein ABSF80_13895 [Chitinispirillaceae bacterium]|jgi:Tfp pilus assembly protein PilV